MRPVLAALYLLTAPAHAEEVRVLDPPARYDHANPDLNPEWMSLDEVDAACRTALLRWGPVAPERIWACAFPGTPCLVYLPRPVEVTPGEYSRLYRHERAHCNGWSHD